MASTNYMFGWDLLYKTIENDLTCEAELIIAIVHWYLVKNTNLLCLSTGSERQIQRDEVGSELLPSGWNTNPNSFSLRYSNNTNNTVFVLIGTVVQESIIINFMSSESLETSNVAFHITNTVKQFKEPIKKAIPDLPSMLDRIKKELVDPIITKDVKTTETQTQDPQTVESPSRYSPLIVPPHNRQPFGHDPHGFDPLRSYDPLRNIGRNDLDPFGGGGGIGGGFGVGGGMLFDPPRSGIGGNLPPFGGGNGGGIGNRPANIPPGARFDPINPFGPPRRINPDNDHFRPPSNYDDMFM